MTDDIESLAGVRARIEQLQETAAALEAFGEREGFPAIERNAARIGDVAAMLAMNVPPELVDAVDGEGGENADGDG